jgi:hypothetical protein
LGATSLASTTLLGGSVFVVSDTVNPAPATAATSVKEDRSDD